MDKQELEDIFNQLTDYIGSVSMVLRVSTKKSRAEFAWLLKKKFRWQVSARTISNIEMGRRKISFAQFKLICEATECSVEKALKATALIQQKEAEPEEDVLRETLEECEYQTWKTQQQGGD